MKYLKYLILLVVVIGLAFSFMVYKRLADQKHQAQQFAEAAASYLNAQGKDQSLAEFNRKDGSFTKGDLYIIAYDYDGNTLADGSNPAFVGKNLIDYKDKNGVLVVKALIDKAKAGGGWVDYYWPQPSTQKEVLKSSYVIPFDGYLIGAGYYMKWF